MAKRQNLIPTVNITIAATPQIEKYLEQLVQTGIYGKNTAEAAVRLIERGIEQLVGKEKGLVQLDQRSSTRKK